MDEASILESRDTTGKGGRYKLYSQRMDERKYQKHIVRTVVESMMRDFPEETREVLKEY